jgi:3',5'-cyclic AMP phosphodiesterase CpdA
MRTIAHISDLHFGRHSEVTAEALIASVNDSNPHLIALSGDFTQRARHSEFAEARRFLDRLPQPKLLVPGNHDVPLYNIFSRFLRPFTKYDHHFAALGQPANFFRDEEIAVLGINTARSFTRKNGRISIEQMQRIGDVFREIPGGIAKVLVTHHPLAFPIGSPSLELAGRAARALEIIKTAGVHLLLSGHHHRASSGSNAEVDADGTVLVLHAGTAISTRTRGSEGNSYNLLDIDGGRVSVRLMEYVEDSFQEKRIDRFAIDGNRWRRDDPV